MQAPWLHAARCLERKPLPLTSCRPCRAGRCRRASHPAQGSSAGSSVGKQRTAAAAADSQQQQRWAAALRWPSSHASHHAGGAEGARSREALAVHAVLLRAARQGREGLRWVPGQGRHGRTGQRTGTSQPPCTSTESMACCIAARACAGCSGRQAAGRTSAGSPGLARARLGGIVAGLVLAEPVAACSRQSRQRCDASQELVAGKEAPSRRAAGPRKHAGRRRAGAAGAGTHAHLRQKEGSSPLHWRHSPKFSLQAGSS